MCFILYDRLGPAAAASFHSCPTLCDPIDGSPPGSSVPTLPQMTQFHFLLHKNKKFHDIYVSHLLYAFICQWTLGYFHFLAIVNSAAVDIRMHVSFWVMVLVIQVS